MRAEFARWAKYEPAIDRELRAFLGRAFNLKSIADYDTGPEAKVTHAQATDAIAAAHRFVAIVKQLINP